MLSRRRFIQVGLVGGAVLVAVRAAYGPFSSDPSIPEDPEFNYLALNIRDRTIVAAVSPVMLAGALPEDAAGREHALMQVIRGVDTAVSGLPSAVQDEVAQLFALLGFPVTRRIVAGVTAPWLRAKPEQISAFLERWRSSRFALLRSGYRGLQELIMAAWYGAEAAWPRIGYPGPPALTK
ncbi:MAG TPA: hypothetical protein VMH32_04205 [Burkholderiales bacterium]|nr:hypothetical protein [Burkholderiales bacterium]